MYTDIDVQFPNIAFEALFSSSVIMKKFTNLHWYLIAVRFLISDYIKVEVRVKIHLFENRLVIRINVIITKITIPLQKYVTSYCTITYR